MKMKISGVFLKATILVLTLVMMISVTSCDNTDNNGTSAPEVTTTAPTTPTEVETYTAEKYFLYAEKVYYKISAFGKKLIYVDEMEKPFLNELIEVPQDKANFTGIGTYRKNDNTLIHCELKSLKCEGFTFSIDLNDKGQVVKNVVSNTEGLWETLEISYTDSGKISKFTVSNIHDDLSFGREYEYDSYNRPITVKNYDAEGTLLSIYKNTFDKKGNCVEIAIYNTNNSLSHKRIYTYDERNNVIKKTESAPNETIISFTEYAYTYKEKVTFVDSTVHYPEDQRAIHVTEELDKNGKIIKSIAYSANTDDINNVREFTYNKYGQQIAYTMTFYSNKVMSTTSFYDDNGKMTSRLSYDKDGNKDFQTFYDKDGNKTSTVHYDENGNPIE